MFLRASIFDMMRLPCFAIKARGKRLTTEIQSNKHNVIILLVCWSMKLVELLLEGLLLEILTSVVELFYMCIYTRAHMHLTLLIGYADGLNCSYVFI